jgi:hypothetical protein
MRARRLDSAPLRNASASEQPKVKNFADTALGIPKSKPKTPQPIVSVPTTAIFRGDRTKKEKKIAENDKRTTNNCL